MDISVFSMELVIYLTLFVIFIVLLGIISIYFLRKHIDHVRSLDRAYLRILIPRKDSDSDERKEQARDFKEYIGIMEQLLVAMGALYSGSFVNKLLWQHTYSLEYIAHQDQIYFYIVVPTKYQVLIEKQITSYFPDAVLENTDEINIFQDATHSSHTHMYLRKNYVYPIKTYDKLESDPINNITNALSKLDFWESCAFQILLRPTDNSWQNKASKKASKLEKGSGISFTLNPFSLILSAIRALVSSGDDSDGGSGKDSGSALESDATRLIDEKGKKIGYDTIIRIITTGRDQNACDMELKNIISAFEQFASPETNGFSPGSSYFQSKTIRNYIYRLFGRTGTQRWKKMILNVSEISSLFHLPHSKYNRTPEIKWQNFKIVKSPDNIPKEWLLLGYNNYRGVKRPIYLKNEDRFRHFYIIGQTGSGKSVMLNNMAIQDVRAGRGICVMDPHGDLAADVIKYVPRERADDVIYFNPGDIQRPMGINLLEADTADEKEMVAQEANKMMIKLYGNEVFGPRIQDYFMNAVLTLMDYTGGGTICDVMPMVSNKSFQEERRRTIKNKVVKAWWENMYDQQGDREKKEILPYFQAKFSPFSTNEMIRNIIGQTKSSFRIDEAMDTNKILLLNLSKGLLGDLNANLLGMIFVSKIQGAAMKRQKIDKDKRVDFFFYIDEFQNFVSDSIESILSEARKYRLSLNMAHQYIGQLEKSDAISKSSLNLKDAVFGNVANKMAYRIGPEDGEFLAKEFGPEFSDSDLVLQDALKASCKISIDNQPSRPFSLDVIKYWEAYEPEEAKLAKAFVELSRLKYGREKEFVDKEILFRIGSWT